MKNKKKILIYISNLYVFDEFYKIIIENLYQKKIDIFLLIEKNEINEDYFDKIITLKSKNIICEFWYLEIISGNKFKNFANLYFLLQNLSKIDLFLTPSISDSETFIICKEILKNNGKVIVYINDLLHESIWKAYSGNKKKFTKKILEIQHMHFNALISKIKLSIKTRVLIVKRKLINQYKKYLTEYVLPIIYLRKIIKKNISYNYNLFNNDIIHIVSCPEEEKALNKIIPNLNVVLAKPPYFFTSKKTFGKNLLVLVPGPFSNSQLELYSEEFIKVIRKIAINAKPPKIYFRFHPRQDNELKLKFISLNGDLKIKHKIKVQQNSKDKLLETISKCSYVVGSSSNALRVSRLYKKNLNVIGVLNAFYSKGIWGENIFLSGVECIKWVKSSNEINFNDYSKNNTFKKYNNVKSYIDILIKSLA